jgi:hypothetical protein
MPSGDLLSRTRPRRTLEEHMRSSAIGILIVLVAVCGDLGSEHSSRDQPPLLSQITVDRTTEPTRILDLLGIRSASAQSLTCGLKPLPSLGCRIGRCVNGAWEQICDQSPAVSCGLQPLPAVGCRIGRCVSGVWEQVCDRSPSLSCGLKPLPRVGCRIGRCVDGVWEQVCN